MIQVLKPENGLLSIVPVIFNNENYSVANIVVHSSILGYTFRACPLYYSMKEDFVRIVPNKPVVRHSIPFTTNFKELIFPAELDLTEFSSDYLEGLYNEFVGSLLRSYSLLEGRVKIMSQQFLTKEKDIANKAIPSSCSLKNQGIIAQEEEKVLNTKDPTKTIISDEKKKAWLELVKTFKSTTEVTDSIQKETASQGVELLKLWNKYLEIVISIPHKLAVMLLKEYNKARAESFTPFICQSKTEVTIYPILPVDDKFTNHKKLIKASRKVVANKYIDSYPLKDITTFGSLDSIPILFEDIFIKNSNKKNDLANVNHTGKGCLFVFVHGYLASSFDTALMKNVIAVRFPEAETLCACNNEGHTEGDIEEMGGRLAKEVITYICDWFPKGTLKNLSFIGHSLGGLIIRAALTHLADYKDKMRVFLTLSTPHLGYTYQSSSLVGTGMWFLKKWKRSKSLSQLEMSDNKDITKTVIYKLSEAEGLNWFKRIILLSSYQDHYSPYESSRIEVKPKYDSNSLKEYAYMEMAGNIMKKLNADAVHRVDVGFNIKASNVNTFIGREAHLLFLTCETLLRIIAYRYSDFFVTP